MRNLLLQQLIIIIFFICPQVCFASSSEQADATSTTGSGADWTNPNNARSNDGPYAETTEDNTTPTGYLIMSGFTTSIATKAKIVGITVQDDAFYIASTGSCGTRTQTITLSWDGGTTYTTGKATPSVSTTETTYTLGTSLDTWGRAWRSSELGANFRIRMSGRRSTCVDVGIAHVVEYLSRTVYYRARRTLVVGSIASEITKYIAAFFHSDFIYSLYPNNKKETSSGFWLH